ncbi:hypothetical protein NUU61_000587 [Penicillium alfredii]|uniref:Uncharacterized protein n=1 Tax=Penicillium alfredii TaxID=1506179 RepID=A0A9W9GAD4_9EURO|nr:uncharacterized protein NUU61_000587 [Penicillium alfredii]KAJ5114828.1 hypothetical protein NUU61_000587 [Penicillium alfredii]
MAKHSLRRVIAYIVVPTGAASYGIHRGLSHLEEKYPELPAKATTSTALRTPSSPATQRCAYTDVYATRVPLPALELRTRPSSLSTTTSDKTALEDAWARSVIGSKLLRAEGFLIGLFKHGRYTPGNTGDTEAGFAPDAETGAPRELLNGMLVAQREPGSPDADSNGLLISWQMADEPRAFFEKIARWGYPWRLMSGGRHEMSVSEPFEMCGQGRVVEVRFATAHDYEVVPEEGGPETQKIIPGWTARLHRGYARLVLDLAAREVEQADWD